MDLNSKAGTHSGIGATFHVGSEESARRYGVPIGTDVDLGMIAFDSSSRWLRLKFKVAKALGRKVAMF